jgi:predicted CXXCH cytochrome family protein
MIVTFVRNAMIVALSVALSMSAFPVTIQAQIQDPSEKRQTLKSESGKTNGKKSKVELKKHFPTKQLEKGKDVKWTHAPYNKGTCNLCHETNDLEKPGPMRASVNKICFSCHEREHKMMKSRTVIHEPVAKDCGYCHNAHNSKYKSLLYKPMDELCVTCHTDQKAEINAKVQHDPVTKDKLCRNCHETHGGNIKKRLLAPEDRLCVECHGGKKKPAKDDKGKVLANIKALQGKKVKHGPFGENNCSECHNSGCWQRIIPRSSMQNIPMTPIPFVTSATKRRELPSLRPPP